MKKHISAEKACNAVINCSLLAKRQIS